MRSFLSPTRLVFQPIFDVLVGSVYVPDIPNTVQGRHEVTEDVPDCVESLGQCCVDNRHVLSSDLLGLLVMLYALITVLVPGCPLCTDHQSGLPIRSQASTGWDTKDADLRCCAKS